MRLVITYVAGDGCTYSCAVVTPVVCSSAEEFIVGFEAALKKSRKDKVGVFTFCGEEWSVDDFYWGYPEHGATENYELPNVMTVDEWFEGLH